MCKAAVLQVVPYIDKDSFGTKLLAGMASGMLGAGVANPADVVRLFLSRLDAPTLSYQHQISHRASLSRNKD